MNFYEINGTVDIPTTEEKAYAQTNERITETKQELTKYINDNNEKIKGEIDSVNKYIDCEISNTNRRIDNIVTNSTTTEGNSELIDIRAGTDGIVYDSAGTAVREQIKNIKNKVMADKSIDINTSESTESTTQINVNTSRWFLNYNNHFDKNTVIDSLSILVSKHPTYHCTYELEFWSVNDTVLTLSHSIQFITDLSNVSNTVVTELQTVPVNYTCDGETIISVKLISAEYTSASLISLIVKENEVTYKIANVDDTTLSTADFVALNNYAPCVSVSAYIPKWTDSNTSGYEIIINSVAEQINQTNSSVDKLTNIIMSDASVGINTSESTENTIVFNVYTTRFFLNYNNHFDKNAVIDSLSILVSKHPTYHCTYELEFWSVNDTALTLSHSVQFITDLSNVSNTVITELQTVPVNYTCDSETIISVKLISAEYTSASFISFIAKENETTYKIANVDDTTLSTSDFSTLNNYAPCASVSAYIPKWTENDEEAIKEQSKIVTVKQDGTGDYETITDAVANEPEGTSILIYEGVYDGTVEASNKRIVLRGVDRNKCIIRSTNGLYAKPAINISVGYLENLTIYSQYVEGVSAEIQDGVQMAYGIHAESEYAVGGTLELHHCTVKSDFSSAFGLGLRKDNTVILDDCIFISAQYKAQSNYPNGLGALYFHDSIGEGGNSYITVKNCLLQSKLGYSMCPYMANIPTSETNRVYCTFLNNVLYDEINGYENNIYFRNDPFGENGNFEITIGYGNSNDNLNNN